MSTTMSCVSSMTAESKDSIEFIYCACGCQKTLAKYDNWARERKYIHGHWNYNKPYSKEIGRKISQAKIGKPCSEETKIKISKTLTGRKISEEHKKNIGIINKGKIISEEHRRKIGLANRGEKSGNWKADNVKYGALHRWIKINLSKPKDGKCILCHQNPFKLVACLTGIYNRELRNWAWFCIPCHSKWDNLVRNLNRNGSL